MAISSSLAFDYFPTNQTSFVTALQNAANGDTIWLQSDIQVSALYFAASTSFSISSSNFANLIFGPYGEISFSGSNVAFQGISFLSNYTDPTIAANLNLYTMLDCNGCTFSFQNCTFSDLISDPFLSLSRDIIYAAGDSPPNIFVGPGTIIQNLVYSTFMDIACGTATIYGVQYFGPLISTSSQTAFLNVEGTSPTVTVAFSTFFNGILTVNTNSLQANWEFQNCNFSGNNFQFYLNGGGNQTFFTNCSFSSSGPGSNSVISFSSNYNYPSVPANNLFSFSGCTFQGLGTVEINTQSGNLILENSIFSDIFSLELISSQAYVPNGAAPLSPSFTLISGVTFRGITAPSFQIGMGVNFTIYESSLLDSNFLASVSQVFTLNSQNAIFDKFLANNINMPAGNLISLNSGSFVTIANSVFSNVQGADGAVVYSINGGSLFVDSCMFNGCGGVAGGVMLITSGFIMDSVFTQNSAEEGGAITFQAQSTSLSISNCTFEQNTADDGSALLLKGSGTASISDCTFNGNNARESGAVAASISYFSIDNCNFTNNVAFVGAAIFVASTFQSPFASVTNSVFFGNQAVGAQTGCTTQLVGQGGAITYAAKGQFECFGNSFVQNVATVSGGALCLLPQGSLYSLNISNCNFIENESPDELAIFLLFQSPLPSISLSQLSFTALPFSCIPNEGGFDPTNPRSAFVLWTPLSAQDSVECVECNYDSNCANLLMTSPVSIQTSPSFPSSLTVPSGLTLQFPSTSTICLTDFYNQISTFGTSLFSLNLSLSNLGPVFDTSAPPYFQLGQQSGFGLTVTPTNGCFDLGGGFSVNGVPQNSYSLNMELVIDPSVTFFENSTLRNLVVHLQGCEPGYYHTDHGCLQCPLGQINPIAGASKCVPCGPAFVSDSTRTVCLCPSCLPQFAITGLLSMSSILGFLSLTTLCAIFSFRNIKAVKAASPLFLCISLVGLIMVAIGPAANALLFSSRMSQQTVLDSLCFIEPASISIGFCLVFGSLIGKTFRVWKIFSAVIRSIRMKNYHLLSGLAAYLFVTVAILVWWAVSDFPHLHTSFGVRTCSSRLDAIFVPLLVAIGFLVICFGMALSVATRKVTEQFNESRLIATSIYSILFGGVIQLVLYLVNPEMPVVPQVIIQLNILTVLGVLFGPKLWAIWKSPELSKALKRGFGSGGDGGDEGGSMHHHHMTHSASLPSGSCEDPFTSKMGVPLLDVTNSALN